MKLVRLAVATALGASALVGVQANAAPPCKMITDAKGNGSVAIAGPVATPNDDRLDILSADIASNSAKSTKKRITAVIRLAKMDGTSALPGGTHYHFYFNAPGITNQLYMEYFTGSPVLPETYAVGFVDPVTGITSLSGADGFISESKGEVHISANLIDFDATGGGLLKPGMKLTNLQVRTSVDGVLFIFYANSATTTKTYTLGAPSCVVPGK